MRPLKPYAVALSGLIAAVFSAIFLGTQSGATSLVRLTSNTADLQTRSTAPAREIAAGSETQPAGKPRAPLPHFPTTDFSRAEALRLARVFDAQRLVVACERIVDRRQQSLVGIVELRI